VQVCNDEAAHDQINPNAQELGGEWRLEDIRIEQEPCRADLLDATHCRAGSGTSCFAGRDVDDRRFAFAMRGRSVLGVSAMVVGIATGFGDIRGIRWRKTTCDMILAQQVMANWL
jgi:hypothetical protein